MVDYHYLDSTKLEEVSVLYKARIDEHCDFEYEMELDVDYPNIAICIPSRDYEKACQFFYSDEFYKFKQEVQEKFGYHSVYPSKIASTAETDVPLGSFVLIDSPLGDEFDVGIVTSVITGTKEKYYGCSYVRFGFNTTFTNQSLHPLFLTEEDYGGYHIGFKKILSPDEVRSILTEKLEEEYQKSMGNINQMAKFARADIDKLCEIVTNDKIFESKNSVKFKAVGTWLPDSLQDFSSEGD